MIFRIVVLLTLWLLTEFAVGQDTFTNDKVNTVQAVGDFEVIAVEYPPFTTMGEPEHGINFVLLDKLMTKYDIHKPIPLFLPPARAQLQVQSGKWCLSFFPPPKYLLSTFLPLSDQKVILGLFRRTESSNFDWQHLSELKGKKLALMRYKHEGPFQKQFIDAGIEIIQVESLAQGFKMLQYNRIDLVFSNQFPDFFKQLPESERELFQFSKTSILETNVGVYINNNCLEIYRPLLSTP
ncbi:transporter substrate-binding domain-containing protein [Shewanella subflava]|uniref:Transporter substrate-binding domain-containing protein n=1 Tax=Shewanella subflava TaxID=2986476 RepID=A0ABT3I9B2_9GAMM|nr:transporter substrate-binding domain-containing protein [Shewanella subflava]MCW3172433.1 transporter substrate-binding domain-containing protein [Shewanella subflava]